jgi:hypothetical protein
MPFALQRFGPASHPPSRFVSVDDGRVHPCCLHVFHHQVFQVLGLWYVGERRLVRSRLSPVLVDKPLPLRLKDIGYVRRDRRGLIEVAILVFLPIEPLPQHHFLSIPLLPQGHGAFRESFLRATIVTSQPGWRRVATNSVRPYTFA